MPRSVKEFDMEAIVINELLNMALELKPMEFGDWVWREKEFSIKGKQYLIGGFLRRHLCGEGIDIASQQCLMKQ